MKIIYVKIKQNNNFCIIRLSRFLHGFLEDSPEITQLIGGIDLKESPEYIRAVRFNYRFQKGDNQSAWWTREQLDIFTPSFSRDINSMSTQRQQQRSRRNKKGY